MIKLSPSRSRRRRKADAHAKMLDAMDELTGVRARAPIRVEDVILPNILGSGSNIVATRNVARS